MKGVFFLLSLLVLVAKSSPWMNLQATPSERANILLAQMTQAEKISMIHGEVGLYIGNVAPIPRLGIPALKVEDGPQGFGDLTRGVTMWPSAFTIINTFDRKLQKEFAIGMGQEFRAKGANVFLGPMVNIARVPTGGRNFESFGEEPYLSAEMTKETIKGIQSQGVIACVKHFANNNQEYERQTTSANVDERTQYELYYPPFEAAIEANVGTVMCGYNRVNGTSACENYQLLQTDLKDTLKFPYWIMSDWTATHSTAKPANAGLDQEFPYGSFFKNLDAAIQAGDVPQSRLDDMVLRILTSMFTFGLFDNPQTGEITNNVTSPEHAALSRKLGAQSTVVLKNDAVSGAPLLPIDLTKIKSIAVIGDNGNDAMIVGGGGSGSVNPPYIISPLLGITNRLVGTGVSVNYTNSSDLTAAANLAAKVDLAIVFVGAKTGEGNDRPTLDLGSVNNNMVTAVLAKNPRTIVVIFGPGAVSMPWVSSIPAIVMPFFPGQEAGNCVSDVLFGDINPSARLAVTFPVDDDSTPLTTPEQYPGIDRNTAYSEGLLVGYRWYQANNKQPLFWFGHGLSYTSFAYSSLVTSDLYVSLTLKNIGQRAGSEVVQLYIGFPAAANEPPKLLKGFEKVYVEVGETVMVLFELKKRDLSIWDVPTRAFTPVSGRFSVYVGASANDIRLTGSLVTPW